MGGRHRLCPTAAGLTSPLPLGVAPQPSGRQLFLHHVRRKMLSEAGSPSLVRVQGVTMRIVVIGLVLLAGLKVWTQDRMYRSVTGEVLIEAYRERAIEVCRKQSAKTPDAAAGTKDLWGSDSEAEVLIGNPGVDVAIWDTQNPRWEERFRHPNLILTGAGETQARCAYDLRDGVATLSTR